MSKPTAETLNDYVAFFDITTRWMDNDVYGHVNNVVYYSYFDSIINQYMIEKDVLDIHHGDQIGLMVQSQCHYFASIAFPDKISGGIRVNRLGNSSVEYGVAIFKEGQESACAQGSLTHVFVQRDTQVPSAITGELRLALESLLVS
ncbi:acyl-CoA thioesterase [Glaciecola sp. XM2]|uniref:acyl-CoA thioesterase n=1 Tax=Glaciecola sp. XM2 TaxID=1914931 RepID=UPI001BDED7E1|nr:thioesterase family protein [Glaciecola sp. XM2]MBT1451842.1 acyl-CoA thioesterase [Glaciecola sp. XM2]